MGGCPLLYVSHITEGWDGKPEPGVVTKLFKNGLVKIQWSDGTKATKVDATKIDASRASAAKEAAKEAANEAAKEAAAATMQEGGVEQEEGVA
eukprot:COSAG05_NODE_4642_length_1427_cov_2.470633_2_plen_93_part_00